ncbi:hypothetical protein JMJ77_0007831 [Colletotrichum scovillei]|uniref:Uncharacterized protein n=1 Tax=Colletotrichum scovillei TaxID=1209932 RepID=A0A9P7RDL0_9PEZI|nr:hypothetical protein JMJ77_0007831 [Colletotrichum scovillei]KAG7074841.1 hypothetical protein JMJ76_0011309 [Colletotrichum scovillei]KAG7081965.1 hypothetical protein JMJ78_0004074 [Colletotrichum scovillei]
MNDWVLESGGAIKLGRKLGTGLCILLRDQKSALSLLRYRDNPVADH